MSAAVQQKARFDEVLQELILRGRRARRPHWEVGAYWVFRNNRLALEHTIRETQNVVYIVKAEDILASDWSVHV